VSSAPARAGLGRKIASWVCILLACLGLIGSVVALWTHTVLFDTDRWVNTVGALPANPQVADALATRVSEEIVLLLQIEDRARQQLPGLATFAAPAIAESTRSLIDRQVERLLLSDTFDQAWETAVRTAHQQVVAVLRDESAAVQTRDGQVVLSLYPLLAASLRQVEQAGLFPDRIPIPDLTTTTPEQARQQLERTFGVRLSPTFGTIPIADARQLQQAQRAVQLFDTLVWVLPVLTIALALLAFWLSPARLRTAVYFGIAVAISLLITRLLISGLEAMVIDALQERTLALTVAQEMLDVVTSGLKRITEGIVVAGVVLAVAALLAGRFRRPHPAPA
jgi:hypothetical protein